MVFGKTSLMCDIFHQKIHENTTRIKFSLPFFAVPSLLLTTLFSTKTLKRPFLAFEN